MPFVTGPYCDINPLYLAYITLRVQLQQQQSSREVLVVGRPCDQLLLKCADLVFQKVPARPPRGSGLPSPSCGVVCVSSALEQYSPSKKKGFSAQGLSRSREVLMILPSAIGCFCVSAVTTCRWLAL